MLTKEHMMSNKKPNIVLLFADDQRHDTIAALGNDAIRTPNLDALTAGGTAFTRAHIMGGTCGAVCMPSRAMLHTGRTLFRIHNKGRDIPPEQVTLGQQLRAHGYETFGTGKWHNGTDSYARSFCDGAEIFFGGMGDHWNVPACDFHPDGNYPTNPTIREPWHSNRTRMQLGEHVRCGVHSTDLFAEATESFLDRRPTDKPFFAYVSFMAPHDPRSMPGKYLEMYRPEDIELPASFMPEHPFDNGELVIRDEQLAHTPRDPEEIRRHIAEYYAMITHLDDAVGRIVAKLRSIGEYENTIIVFAGDNGLAVGRHGLMGKQNLYDHSVRVPLILAGPGIPAGATNDALASLNDLFATLCDLVEVPCPDSVECPSLAPCISGGPAPRQEMLLAYRDVQRGVTDGRYKYIEYRVNGKRTTQLFDLHEDPDELNDLADTPAGQVHVERLGPMLTRWRDQLGDDTDFWNGLDHE
jgi:arylsulfatase A-like enzyme